MRCDGLVDVVKMIVEIFSGLDYHLFTCEEYYDSIFDMFDDLSYLLKHLVVGLFFLLLRV